jgi:hypothetical protein
VGGDTCHQEIRVPIDESTLAAILAGAQFSSPQFAVVFKQQVVAEFGDGIRAEELHFNLSGPDFIDAELFMPLGRPQRTPSRIRLRVEDEARGRAAYELASKRHFTDGRTAVTVRRCDFPEETIDFLLSELREAVLVDP